MNTVMQLSREVQEISEELLSLSADLEQSEALVDARDATNMEAERSRNDAVAAVERLRQALESLDPTDPARLEDVRRMIEGLRADLRAADLSGVYESLMERLLEQRAERESLEAELEGLSREIERVRQIGSVLPTGCNERI